MKTLLMTGANGFLGHHALAYLLDHTDWEVVCLVRVDYAGDLAHCMTPNIRQQAKGRVRMVYHDLQFPFPDYLVSRIGAVDYVLHLAASSHVARSIVEPRQFVLDNVLGTCNLLEYVRFCAPRARVLNFGTDEVFGEAKENQKFKEIDEFHPGNPYSATKTGQIALGMAYERTYNLDLLWTFTMNLFGERQNPEKFLPKVIRQILAGEPVRIHSKIDDMGTVEFVSSRNWLHVYNASDACLFLLRNGKAGQGYNMASDIELPNDDMARKVAGIMGREVKIEYVDYRGERPGMDRRYSLDGTKMYNMGWRPPLDFEDSLRQAVLSEVDRIERGEL